MVRLEIAQTTINKLTTRNTCVSKVVVIIGMKNHNFEKEVSIKKGVVWRERDFCHKQLIIETLDLVVLLLHKHFRIS